MNRKLDTFIDRLEEGLLGELIAKTAFELGIIPSGDPTKIEQPPVDPADENSVRVNLVNGDLRFLDFNMAYKMVDVKSGDFISERSLANLAEGSYILFNANPDTKKRVGRPFMIKMSEELRYWIRMKGKKFVDKNEGVSFRVLRWQLELHFKPEQFWDFSEAEFCKHRTEMLIKHNKMTI